MLRFDVIHRTKKNCMALTNVRHENYLFYQRQLLILYSTIVRLRSNIMQNFRLHWSHWIWYFYVSMSSRGLLSTTDKCLCEYRLNTSFEIYLMQNYTQESNLEWQTITFKSSYIPTGKNALCILATGHKNITSLYYSNLIINIKIQYGRRAYICMGKLLGLYLLALYSIPVW